MPRCLGAIDGPHIHIERPSENSTDYLNRKYLYSLNIQTSCYYSHWLFDVVKWPGSVHDWRIFANSTLNAGLENRNIPKSEKELFPCEKIPVYIIGDPAYTTLPYMMKEYPGGGKTALEQYFG